MKNNLIGDIFNKTAKRVRVLLVGNLEVKVSMVLDKKDPTNLSRAYILVASRDITSSDKRFRFVYRSKMNSIGMTTYSSLDFSDVFTVKRIVKYKLGFEYGSDEYKRFDVFASTKGISYKQIQDSLNEASKKATVRYLKMTNRRDLAHLV